MTRNFLDIADCDAGSLKAMLADGLAIKAKPDLAAGCLAGKSIALMFQKPSTRTRVSFEVGVAQMGGKPIVLDTKSMQLGRGETVADTAQTLSRYVDAIMLRANSHAMLTELAAVATIPIINGLSDVSHPCQVMADVMTLAEKKGTDINRDLPRLSVLWAGDFNNVTQSWIEAAVAFGFSLRIATPPSLAPTGEIKGGRITLGSDAMQLAEGVDAIATDTWFSMGEDGDDKKASSEAKKRADLLAPFQVTRAMMQRAKPDAIFMHCLPVYRGNEATAAVVDGKQSVIFDEAENRLHAQKAILRYCLGVV